MKKKILRKPAEEKNMEKRSINNPTEVNTEIDCIPVYGPNQGLTAKEYQLSPQFNDLEANFKSYCMEFLEKAKPDAYNASYEDAVIERICVEAINFIKVQRADHVRTITKLLDNMHNGDYEKCKCRLENFKRLREENAKELALYKRIYRAGTSLEEMEGDNV